MERKKMIVITPEENKYLQRLFGVSAVTVWHAIKYHRNNEIHKKIRTAAIERGGQQMVLTHEFDTIYITNREDADGTMSRYLIQPFRNGALIEGSLRTGQVTLRNKHGEVVRIYDNPLLSEMKKIQERAMSL
jgi:hypothetical protein